MTPRDRAEALGCLLLLAVPLMTLGILAQCGLVR